MKATVRDLPIVLRKAWKLSLGAGVALCCTQCNSTNFYGGSAPDSELFNSVGMSGTSHSYVSMSSLPPIPKVSGLPDKSDKPEKPVKPKIIDTAFEDTVSYWHDDESAGEPRIDINLSQQRASFYRGKKLVGLSVISSGDAAHPTPTGHFHVEEKDANHHSTQYGDYVDAHNDVVAKDIDNEIDHRPAGTHFAGCEMLRFMRFSNGKGMHAGYLPGYPASPGCVRMPLSMAEAFFKHASVGTEVNVHY